MSSWTNLQFYSASGGGDAQPFTANGLLVVGGGADGAGIVTGDWDGERGDAFLSRLYHIIAATEGMTDQLESGSGGAWLRTYLNDWLQQVRSAKCGTVFPAAQIAAARLLFALVELPGYLENLDDEAARASLAAFVAEGLVHAAEKFGLNRKSSAESAVLPASLAAVSYTVEDGFVTADVIWAGNCRCYALGAQGAKRLTAHGTEADGSARRIDADDSAALLQYRKYKLALPCMLLAVTDSACAPYAPHGDLGIEAAVLSALHRTADGEACCAALKSHYGQMQAGAAAAIACVGFESWQQTRLTMTARTERVVSLWNGYCRMCQTQGAEGEAAMVNPVISVPYKTVDVLDGIQEYLREYSHSGEVCDFILTATCPARLGNTPLGNALFSLRAAAHALDAAKRVFDESCRRRSEIVSGERDVLALLGKRRSDIQRERERIGRECEENTEKQKAIIHVKMVRLNEKIAWLTSEQVRLREQYRQSCNPHICRQCDPRCRLFATRPNALSAEIRLKASEKDDFTGRLYLLRDEYARLKNDYAQLENRDSALEREDAELARLADAYESGRKIHAESYRSGTAQRFAERISQAGSHALDCHMEEAEKLFDEKKQAYDNALNAFFYDAGEVYQNARKLFRPQFLESQGFFEQTENGANAATPVPDAPEQLKEMLKAFEQAYIDEN